MEHQQGIIHEIISIAPIFQLILIYFQHSLNVASFSLAVFSSNVGRWRFTVCIVLMFTCRWQSTRNMKEQMVVVKSTGMRCEQSWFPINGQKFVFKRKTVENRKTEEKQQHKKRSNKWANIHEWMFFQTDSTTNTTRHFKPNFQHLPATIQDWMECIDWYFHCKWDS